jgi:hypothetical protein
VQLTAQDWRDDLKWNFGVSAKTHYRASEREIFPTAFPPGSKLETVDTDEF